MRSVTRLLLLAIVATMLVVALISEFPLCPMASTLGVPCPGCGLTRATLALLRGDVSDALRFHPLVFLLTPLFVAFMAVAIGQLFRDPVVRSSPRPSLHWTTRRVNLMGGALLVLVLGVWLARFAGYFGGPVAVTSLSSWLASFKH